MRLAKSALILASLAAIVAATAAEAAPRRSGERQLTVQKRSFLNSGAVVPYGYNSAYMVDHSYLLRTFARDYPMARPR